MPKQPEGGKAPNDKSGKMGDLKVKSDTFKQTPGAENVKGGRMMQTDNATKENAYCCGE